MEKVKKKRGRPALDKSTRAYTLDRKLAEFLDTLKEGDRSRFVNSILQQGMELEQLQQVGKFYTYVLMRPDGSIFYVGKGQGNRIDQHEAEARKGIVSHKCNTIRQIWNEEGQMLKQKIAFFDKEEDALQLEMLLIDFLGLDNLTNGTIGGEGVSFGRRKRVPVVLSIADERLFWAIGILQSTGIENPTDQQISRYVKDWCYAKIDEDIAKREKKQE